MRCEGVGDVKEEVLRRGWEEGEVKDDDRGRGTGCEEGDGERGEGKENWGTGLFPGGENTPTGGSFVLERERGKEGVSSLWLVKSFHLYSK